MKKGERVESGITGYKRGRERTSANFKERKRIMTVVRVCWFYVCLSWSEIRMSGSKEVDYGMLYVLFLLYVSYVTCASLERGNVERSDRGLAVNVGGAFTSRRMRSPGREERKGLRLCPLDPRRTERVNPSSSCNTESNSRWPH